MIASKIEWCDFTWNPITGCLNGCSYCYARKMAQRLKGRYGYPADDPFRPTFHDDRMTEPVCLDLKGPFGSKPKIFICSMGDMFSEGVEAAWVNDILGMVQYCTRLNFLVLTKRPDRILELVHSTIPQNLWLGVSVTCQEDAWRIEELKRVLPVSHKFVSFEPLHGPITAADPGGIEWVIVGAETGNRKSKILPELEWIIDLVESAEKADVPVFLKDNLPEEIGSALGSHIQDFPGAMR
jgi:protein gp37